MFDLTFLSHSTRDQIRALDFVKYVEYDQASILNIYLSDQCQACMHVQYMHAFPLQEATIAGGNIGVDTGVALT